MEADQKPCKTVPGLTEEGGHTAASGVARVILIADTGSCDLGEVVPVCQAGWGLAQNLKSNHEHMYQNVILTHCNHED